MERGAWLPRTPQQRTAEVLVAQEKTGLARCRYIQNSPQEHSHRDGVLWGIQRPPGQADFFRRQARRPQPTCHKAQRLAPKGAAWPGSERRWCTDLLYLEDATKAAPQ